MPAVFIHGVPDTYRVWDRVCRHLARSDVLTLNLPGFDSKAPNNFGATKEDYVAWIIDQLERQPGPVDLVGHDWGCIFALRVASFRPDLVRTWAAGGGPVSRAYEWHPLAKLLQTPGRGEEWVANFDPGQFSEQLTELGLPSDVAADTAARMSGEMLQCILRLYRSAVDVGSEWEPALANISSPGLVLWGIKDGGCPVEFADQLARDTATPHVRKFDTGHWFLVEKPADVAAALEQHWNAQRSV